MPDRKGPPEAFVRKGMVPMRRLHPEPGRADLAPVELVTRLGAVNMEFRVANLMPNGSFVLFLLAMAPLVYLAVLGALHFWTGGSNSPVLLVANIVLVLLGTFVLAAAVKFAFVADWRGGDAPVTFDRKRRAVFAGRHPSAGKAEFDWDRLVPYLETRHRGAAVNHALTYVEFDPGSDRPLDFVTVEVQGSDERLIEHTCAYVAHFMERGVLGQPATRLSARPLPGWYAFMPDRLLGLPSVAAKTVWSFVAVLFVWPVVAWSRMFRHLQRGNRWPAPLVRTWEADNSSATEQERGWLEANVLMPERVPLAARIAFVLAVLVSAPLWWRLANLYVGVIAQA